MFCKAAFIDPSKEMLKEKDFQHGQRTEDGLAAIQFGPLFTVSTIIITNHDYHRYDYVKAMQTSVCVC